MCGTCGCDHGATSAVTLLPERRLLAANDLDARHNRDHFAAGGVLAINLMGSPGAGKTALLEATARRLGPSARLAALSADLATERDALRLRQAGIPATAITTGAACHLDAEMVHQGLHTLGDGYDVLFIENVGNLVCPALFDLGQAANVVVLSVTEGEDKPLKYPPMFAHADLVVLSKIDLLPLLPEFDLAALEAALAQVMPTPRLLALSARTGEGLHGWLSWLAALRRPGLGAR